MKETNASLALRAQIIFKTLKKAYPDAKCSLNYRSPLELLVATILSAQCTDDRVNKVTIELFRKYPTIESYAKADIKELEQDIRSTGFYRNKAKNIKAASQRLIEVFHGKIPQTMEELLSLPGVARKTANVVLGNAFAKAEGFVVDTHVFRLSRRMGFTKQDTPEKIEQDLMRLFKKDQWILMPHLFILHGRKICAARKPLCEVCPISKDCPKLFI